MGWLTNAFRRYVSGEQHESYDRCLSRLRHVQIGDRVTTADRVEQLEDDLARAVLLVHTLTEACILKGVFTREEIARAASEIDLFDGAADGKLDPAVLRPGQSE
jgi:hypothetical protein